MSIPHPDWESPHVRTVLVPRHAVRRAVRSDDPWALVVSALTWAAESLLGDPAAPIVAMGDPTGPNRDQGEAIRVWPIGHPDAEPRPGNRAARRRLHRKPPPAARRGSTTRAAERVS